MDGILDFAKKYWIIGVIAVIVIVLFMIMNGRSNTMETLQAEIDAMSDVKAERVAEAEAMADETFDSEGHIEQIETTTVSAEEIGEIVIKLDNELTAFYKTAEALPEDEDEYDAMFEQLEKNQALNADLRGISNHGDTWQLNPDWTLELDSIVAYQATASIPVIFTMTTEDGDNAGVVRATYNVEDNTLSNIVRQYTSAGLDDAASIGGR